MSKYECHEAARACVELARMSDDPELRHELFERAREWMALAMEQERDAVDLSVAA